MIRPRRARGARRKGAVWAGAGSEIGLRCVMLVSRPGGCHTGRGAAVLLYGRAAVLRFNEARALEPWSLGGLEDWRF
jgi:hypothetical protein